MLIGWSASAQIGILCFRKNSNKRNPKIAKVSRLRLLTPRHIFSNHCFSSQALAPTAYLVSITPCSTTTARQTLAPYTRSILLQPPLKQGILKSLVDHRGTPAVPVCPPRSHLVPMWLLHPTRRRLARSASDADLSTNFDLFYILRLAIEPERAPAQYIPRSLVEFSKNTVLNRYEH